MPKRAYSEFEPIILKAREWPVVRLAKERVGFIREVTEDSYNKIISQYKDKESLREEIETTLFREKLRIKRNPWRVDPPDEKVF